MFLALAALSMGDIAQMGRTVASVPTGWEPGKNAPPIDVRAEVERYVGKVWRHRFTQQVRDIFCIDDSGFVCCGQRTGQAGGAHGRLLAKAAARKALQWLRNAEAVGNV